jgi:signal transduction histidine kinase
VKQAASEEGIKLDVELPESLASVKGDREKLTQVVINLLNNALGLAICKGIIEAHNGHIMAESELGKGSTFIFRLEKWVSDKTG